MKHLDNNNELVFLIVNQQQASIQSKRHAQDTNMFPCQGFKTFLCHTLKDLDIEHVMFQSEITLKDSHDEFYLKHQGLSICSMKSVDCCSKQF